MVWRVVCNSISLEKRHGRELCLYIAFGFIVLTCPGAFGQENLSSGSSSQVQSRSDSLTALFEDIYGRFPAGIMPSASLTHNESSFDYTGGSSFSYYMNTGGLDLNLGNRKSYQFTADLQDVTMDRSTPQQLIRVGLSLRPIDGWQFAGTTLLNKNTGQAITDEYSAGVSVTHLSGGIARFSESRMRQYFYFSNLLPDRGQLIVSFRPSYYSRNITAYDQRYSRVETPFAMSYGLPANFILGVNADFLQYRFDYPRTLQTGTMRSTNRTSEATAGLGLSRLLDFGTLLEFEGDFYSLEEMNHDFDPLTGLPVSVPTAREDFSVFSITVSSLFTHKQVSVYDLRRSYYLGNYLNAGDKMNRLRVRYATKDINLPEGLMSPLVPYGGPKFGVDDRFSLGMTSFLQVNLEGALFEQSVRYGSMELSLHSLKFDGAELTDYDYFFGMITRPGQYTSTIGAAFTNEDYLPAVTLSAEIRYGIMKDMDIALNYSYKDFDNLSGQAGSNWGFDLRGNLLGFIRLEGAAGWGSFDFTPAVPAIGYYPESLKTLNFNVTVKTFF